MKSMSAGLFFLVLFPYAAQAQTATSPKGRPSAKAPSPDPGLKYFVGSWVGTTTTNVPGLCKGVVETTNDRFVVSIDSHDADQLLVTYTSLQQETQVSNDCWFSLKGDDRHYSSVSATAKFEGHILKDGTAFKLYLDDGKCITEAGNCFWVTGVTLHAGNCLSR